jgi:hypothetical protein
MSTTAKSKLSDSPETAAALQELCKPFVADGFDPQCVVVQPDEIPFPQDQLLVHHEHMTCVLERHHGEPVRVHVLEEHFDGDLYTRKISLTRGESDTVVEWGIVRLDFRYMDPTVRDEILARQMPLGAILTSHDVLRRIKPRWFPRIPPGGTVLGPVRDAATRSPLRPRRHDLLQRGAANELLEIDINCEK